MQKSMELNNSDQVNLKIAQLNILQGLIARMANYILAIKVVSITVMLSLIVISSLEQVTFYWGLFLIPWLGFTLYHAYFLKLELAFRELYNEATEKIDLHITDFRIDQTTLARVPPSLKSVLCSKSIHIFHVSLLIFISLIYFS